MIFEEGFAGMDGYDKMYWAPRLQSEERQIDNGEEKKVQVLRTPDNTIFTHSNERLRKFFELGGYRAFPEVVTVSIDIREILHVVRMIGSHVYAHILPTPLLATPRVLLAAWLRTLLFGPNMPVFFPSSFFRRAY